MELSERLVRERRARLAAERLLEQKSRELFAANEKLAIHARSLSDQIVEQRQVVIKGLERTYGHVPGVSAATILGNGRVALILDPTDILRRAVRRPAIRTIEPAPISLAG